MNRKLDNDHQVFFYEQDFYVLSNFSAFTLQWKGHRFDTSEAAYHWEKFYATDLPDARYQPAFESPIQKLIRMAPSAHEAFKIAEKHKAERHPNWDLLKLHCMREILREKVKQHEYVQRKLMETGDRQLIEDSWRDDFWGWGANKDGKNMLGQLWMEVRTELQGSHLVGYKGKESISTPMIFSDGIANLVPGLRNRP